ncbi:MAG: ribulose-phosphate 3-epimerase [Bacillota bacterium]|nr:ribulose-phosphate 3-epimerase [Bacillota bacterium]HHU62331.1 ribulose-phosphate 3-epimerase [Natronincola sp.]
MRRISASLLAADFSNLQTELSRIETSDLVHIDVMDGNYVPNISFGLPIIEAVQRCTDLPLDIHLMIENPDRLLSNFAKTQPEILTVHYEAVVHLQKTLRSIRDFGIKAGVSLNPHTPLNGLEYILPDLDLILIMTVNPGYGGQEFIPAMIQKIRDCKKLICDYPIEIQVDGGVSIDNIAILSEAGATNFVAGSAIFKSNDPEYYIKKMRTVN